MHPSPITLTRVTPNSNPHARQAAEKTMQAHKNKMLPADAVPQMSRWVSRTTVTRQASSMTINVAEADTGSTKVRGLTL